MVVSIIIILIVALLVIAVWVSAVQQHKEKQEAERRRELTKFKKIIEETEDVLMNSANIPMSPSLIKVLHQRAYEALKAMVDLSPTSKELKNRMAQAKERASQPAQDDGGTSDNIQVPDNDKLVIAVVQGIKKLRTLLRSEHSKGKVETSLFTQEDKRLERIQLRINIESLIKRGNAARTANMLGSARQYYEKAYATLNATANRDEYTTARLEEVEDQLQAIMSELKATNASDRKKKEDKEKDDLDVLFAPKKKW